MHTKTVRVPLVRAFSCNSWIVFLTLTQKAIHELAEMPRKETVFYAPLARGCRLFSILSNRAIIFS